MDQRVIRRRPPTAGHVSNLAAPVSHRGGETALLQLVLQLTDDHQKQSPTLSRITLTAASHGFTVVSWETPELPRIARVGSCFEVADNEGLRALIVVSQCSGDIIYKVFYPDPEINDVVSESTIPF